MAKRTFSPIEWFHLTELAQAAVLGGLVAGRRWAAGELKFQGGTSLHLIYGSPRFSEDLDFVTATTKGLHAAMKVATGHVRAAFAREFPALVLTLKIRDAEAATDPRNPRLFTLTMAEPNWHQSLKVKVEFFIVDEHLAQQYGAEVRTLAPLRPRLRVDLPQVHLETAELEEILCDKLHALGDRERLKERDVFDLWWICTQRGISAEDAAGQFGQRYRTHLAMYPNGKALPQLADALRARAATLRAAAAGGAHFARTSEAIARWLPSESAKPHILASATHTKAMMEHAAACAIATADVAMRIVDPSGNESDTDARAAGDDDVEAPPRPGSSGA